MTKKGIKLSHVRSWKLQIFGIFVKKNKQTNKEKILFHYQLYFPWHFPKDNPNGKECWHTHLYFSATFRRNCNKIHIYAFFGSVVTQPFLQHQPQEKPHVKHCEVMKNIQTVRYTDRQQMKQMVWPSQPPDLNPTQHSHHHHQNNQRSWSSLQ